MNIAARYVKRQCRSLPCVLGAVKGWMRKTYQMEKLLNSNQLAEILGVKVGTVYSWLSRGVNIPHIKIEGTVRFRHISIERWILEREKERKRKNFEI